MWCRSAGVGIEKKICAWMNGRKILMEEQNICISTERHKICSQNKKEKRGG